MKTLLACLLLTASALSQTPVPAAQNTTNTFLGIEFGKPLNDSEKCPMSQVVPSQRPRYIPGVVNTRCWEATSVSRNYGAIEAFTYHNLMKAGLTKQFDPYPVYGTNIDGKIASISFEFTIYENDDFRSALRDKFGPPSKVDDADVFTKFNVHVIQHTEMWILPDIEIVFTSPDTKVDWGSIRVYTKAYSDKVAKDAELRRKSVRDSF